MATKKPTNPVSSKNIRTALRNWQLAKSERLGDLFYVYDSDQEQTEKIVTFQLDGTDLKKFVKAAKSIAYKKKSIQENFRFMIRLGLDDGYLQSPTFPTKPFFRIFLQPINGNLNSTEECFEFGWNPNPNLAPQLWQNTGSTKDAISGAAAFLFVHSWLESSQGDTDTIFTSFDAQVPKRVRAYLYSKEESQIILGKAEKAASTKGALCLHLGRGPRVSSHPVEFRPILEVANGPNTSAADSDDDAFFDFTLPIPPG